MILPLGCVHLSGGHTVKASVNATGETQARLTQPG